MKIPICVSTLVFMLLNCANSSAQVYKHVSPSGQIIYSDQPVSESGRSTGDSFKTVPPREANITSAAPAIDGLSASNSVCPNAKGVIWSDYFENHLDGWGKLDYLWGKDNLSYESDPKVPGRVLKISYPAGTYDPASMRRLGRAYGGAGFRSNLLREGVDCIFLRYVVRFGPDFDFVRGGKLPGLYGGRGVTGGVIPNGRDGFSARYMWIRGGRGAVYAYLPTSVTWGTYIGTGNIAFTPGRWHVLQEQVVLNEPGKDNGVIRVWLDRKLVIDQSGLRFRDVPSLRISGVYFDTFFGGNDSSWASSKDVSAYFGAFVLSESYIDW